MTTPDQTADRTRDVADAALDCLVDLLERAWVDFLDANPDDLTSPEEMPDHALMTGDQFIEYALSGYARLAEEIETLRQRIADLTGDDESLPRYTTRRLRQEIERQTAEARARAEIAEAEIERLTKINADHCRTVNTYIVDNARQEDARKAAEAALTAAQAENARLREALEPFREIAGEAWADENGWTEAACPRDRICDWFGPSAFLAARRAILSADMPAGGGEPVAPPAPAPDWEKAVEAAWDAYQNCPIDMCNDSDEEQKKCVMAALRAAAPHLGVREPDLD